MKRARPKTVSIHMVDQLLHGHDWLGDGFGRNPDPEVVRPVWEEYGAQLTQELMAENAELRRTPPAPTVQGLPRADAGSGVAGIRRLRCWGWWLLESPEPRNHYGETELEQLDRLDLLTDLERTLLHLEEV